MPGYTRLPPARPATSIGMPGWFGALCERPSVHSVNARMAQLSSSVAGAFRHGHQSLEQGGELGDRERDALLHAGLIAALGVREAVHARPGVGGRRIDLEGREAGIDREVVARAEPVGEDARLVTGERVHQQIGLRGGKRLPLNLLVVDGAGTSRRASWARCTPRS